MRHPPRKATAFIAGAALAFAIVLPALAARNPGHEWGRRNCGPRTSQSRSVADCKRCCGRGSSESHYPTGEEGNCIHFCKRAYWG